MSLKLSFFGSLPINPDNVPENEAYGEGTTRPVGFTFPNIYKLYWTVKSFQCNIQTISQNDPLANVLSNGSFSIGQISSSLNQSSSPDSYQINGKTTIKLLFSQKERLGLRELGGEEKIIYTMDGILGGKTQKKISTGNNLKTFTSLNNNVNEGNLSSAGPIHTLSKVGGSITIDFSNIKYNQGKYYPKIIILTPNSRSYAGIGTYGKLIGGINFDLAGSTISLYSTNLSLTPIAFGSIQIGNSITDRFTYENEKDA